MAPCFLPPKRFINDFVAFVTNAYTKAPKLFTFGLLLKATQSYEDVSIEQAIKSAMNKAFNWIAISGKTLLDNP